MPPPHPAKHHGNHLSTKQEHALKTLHAMEHAPGKSLWPHVHRFQLIKQLEERVRDPAKIDQGNAGWCGPAAVLESMATDAPNGYVKMVLDLMHMGHAIVNHGHLHRIKLTTTPALRHYKFASTKICSADWIPLATIRESVKYPENHSQAWYVKNGTYPTDLVRFYRELGYTQICNYTLEHNVVGRTERDWTGSASNYFGSGYRVSMRINADLLTPATQNNNVNKHPGVVRHNHWVDLISRIEIDRRHPVEQSLLAMHIFSWGSGEKYSVPFSRNLTLQAFASNFFGFVGARY